MIRLIVITGPTASGKTALSLRLAKKFDAEIISADSRQVYRGLDIGSDKAKLKNNRASGIRHYLTDVANPKRVFTVAKYKKLAEKAIQDIAKRGKQPMIVGGTGFYIEALINNSALPEVKPNFKLRRKLEKFSAAELFNKLKKADPRRARNIDKNNKRRLIRALEIVEFLGTVPPLPPLNPLIPFRPLILGLKIPDVKLRRLINHRTGTRIPGIINEIKTLRRAQGISWKRLIAFGLEYRFISWYLIGKLSKREAIEKLKTAVWRYARRQYTFLKRLPVVWIKNQQEAERKIKIFLEE